MVLCCIICVCLLFLLGSGNYSWLHFSWYCNTPPRAQVAVLADNSTQMPVFARNYTKMQVFAHKCMLFAHIWVQEC